MNPRFVWIFIIIVSVCGARKTNDIKIFALLSIIALVEGLSFLWRCFSIVLRRKLDQLWACGHTNTAWNRSFNVRVKICTPWSFLYFLFKVSAEMNQMRFAKSTILGPPWAAILLRLPLRGLCSTLLVFWDLSHNLSITVSLTLSPHASWRLSISIWSISMVRPLCCTSICRLCNIWLSVKVSNGQRTRDVIGYLPPRFFSFFQLS